jgi:hypothetical protein
MSVKTSDSSLLVPAREMWLKLGASQGGTKDSDSVVWLIDSGLPMDKGTEDNQSYSGKIKENCGGIGKRYGFAVRKFPPLNCGSCWLSPSAILTYY